MKLIIKLFCIYFLLLISCKSENKTEDFSATIDGRTLLTLMFQYKDGHDGKFPDKLDLLDFSSLHGGSDKIPTKINLEGWIYNKPKINTQRNSNFVVLTKKIHPGENIMIKLNGDASVEVN